MRRVAYVCADPGVGVWGCKGASAHVRSVLRALRRRGADVTLLATRTGGRPPADLVDLPLVVLPAVDGVSAPERERQAQAANTSLRSALHAAGPFDLVWERYSLWSVAGMEYARATDATRGLLEVNAPLVDEQARHRVLHDRAGASEAARRVMTHADGVVAVSEAVGAWARGHGADPVAVVPNGVDVERFDVAARRGAAGGGDPDGFTAVFVGTLKPWHGVELLVEAVRRAGGAGVAPRLLIVGDGPRRAAVEAAVHRAGLEETTTFAGAVDPDEVPRWLKRAHVGVAPAPSGAETYFSPLKVLEYLAAGLPVVAGNVGQMPALLDYGRTGVLCPPGDAGALAAAIVDLRDDPGLRARLGSRGRVLARAHSWDEVVDRALATVGLSGEQIPEGCAGEGAA